MSPSDRSDSAGGVAQRPELSPLQQRSIHRGACEIMAAEVAGQPARLADPTLAGAAAATVMGAFVTARRNGRLRGCCGSLGKPTGVRGVQLWRKIADPAPVAETELEFVAEFTRTRITLDYKMSQGGQTVYYQVRWVSTRGETGPWGVLVSARGGT